MMLTFSHPGMAFLHEQQQKNYNFIARMLPNVCQMSGNDSVSCLLLDSGIAAGRVRASLRLAARKFGGLA